MGLLAERRQAEDRARALVIEAEDAAQRGEWSHVTTLCAEALASDAGNLAAVALRNRATDAIIAETRARKLQCDKALDRAEKLAKKGRFAEAELAIQEAKGFDPDSAIAAAVEMRIRNARLDQERATALERRTAEVVAKARALFDKGERAQALDELRSFLAREPQVQTISAALARMTAEADRIAAENLRRERVAELAKTAETALYNGDPERALELTREALAAEPADALAQKTQSMASARLRERQLAEERLRQAAEALKNARDLLTRGKFAAARQLAHRAAELRPGDEEPASLLALIGGEESKARQNAQRQAEATRRASAAAPALAMARDAEEKQDFIRAEWSAENALALDADCVEAQEILTRVRTQMATHGPRADDDTGQVSRNLSSDADTVTVGRALPSPATTALKRKGPSKALWSISAALKIAAMPGLIVISGVQNAMDSLKRAVKKRRSKSDDVQPSTENGRRPTEEPVLLGVSAPRRVRPDMTFTARFVAYVKTHEKAVENKLRLVDQ